MILTILNSSIIGFAQTDLSNGFKQKELYAKIDSIIADYADFYDVPGISVGVAQNGKPIYSKGFGVADIDTKVPVTTETLFKTGSVSKVITVTAVMQLVEKGLVDLDDNVIKHVKYFKTNDEYYKLVTVKHLLTHRGGIPGGYINNYGYENPEYDDDAIKRFVKSLADKKCEFTPGEKYEYSNNGFVLLSALVEEVTGVKFETYVAENILKPAGIRESTLDFQSIDKSKLAMGHVIGNGFKNSVNSFFPDTRWITGADGFYASSDDWNELTIALMNDYKYDSRKILKKETLEQMWTKNDESGVGLCWNIYEVWGGKLIEHGGNAPGFSAELAFFDDLAVTVMCNSDTRANREILTAIIKTIKNIEQKPQKTLYDDTQILNTMKKSGIEAGIEEIKRLIMEKGDKFRSRAVMILALSIRQGTAEKKLEYAKEIMETLIEYYPENEFMNLFLAEIYIRLALKHYYITNTLLPGDWGIEKMYKQVKSIDLDFYN